MTHTNLIVDINLLKDFETKEYSVETRPIGYYAVCKEAMGVAAYLNMRATDAVMQVPVDEFLSFCTSLLEGGTSLEEPEVKTGYVVYINKTLYSELRRHRQPPQGTYGERMNTPPYGQPMAQPSPFGQYQYPSSINDPRGYHQQVQRGYYQQRQTPPQEWGQSTARPQEPIPQWGAVPPWNEEAGPLAFEAKMEEMLIVLYKQWQRSQENSSLAITFDQYIRLSYPVLNTL